MTMNRPEIINPAPTRTYVVGTSPSTIKARMDAHIGSQRIEALTWDALKCLNE